MITLEPELQVEVCADLPRASIGVAVNRKGNVGKLFLSGKELRIREELWMKDRLGSRVLLGASGSRATALQKKEGAISRARKGGRSKVRPLRVERKKAA
jgi:hypothetical protein